MLLCLICDLLRASRFSVAQLQYIQAHTYYGVDARIFGSRSVILNICRCGLPVVNEDAGWSAWPLAPSVYVCAIGQVRTITTTCDTVVWALAAFELRFAKWERKTSGRAGARTGGVVWLN